MESQQLATGCVYACIKKRYVEKGVNHFSLYWAIARPHLFIQPEHTAPYYTDPELDTGDTHLSPGPVLSMGKSRVHQVWLSPGNIVWKIHSW